MERFDYPPRPCCPSLHDVVGPAAPRPAFPVHGTMDRSVTGDLTDAASAWYLQPAGCAQQVGWEQGLPARYRAPLATQPAVADNPGAQYDARQHLPLMAGRIFPPQFTTTAPQPTCFCASVADTASLVACKWKLRWVMQGTAHEAVFYTKHLLDMVMASVDRSAYEAVARRLQAVYTLFTQHVSEALGATYPHRDALVESLRLALTAHVVVAVAYFRALADSSHPEVADEYAVLLQQNTRAVAGAVGALRPSVLTGDQALALWSRYVTTAVFEQGVARQRTRFADALRAHEHAKEAAENVFEAVGDAIDVCDTRWLAQRATERMQSSGSTPVPPSASAATAAAASAPAPAPTH